jgi:hypothetical protein
MRSCPRTSALRRSCGTLMSAPSFNGRTSASGAEYWGSNPYGAAKFYAVFVHLSAVFFLLSAGQQQIPCKPHGAPKLWSSTATRIIVITTTIAERGPDS